MQTKGTETQKGLHQQIEDKKDEVTEWRNMYHSQLSQYNSLREDTRKIEEDLKSLKECNKTIEQELERIEAKNKQLARQLENEIKAKEDALSRLSSMASNKLRDNNPDIADLSDPNRPNKLSEQFSELYDTEWTDAFEDLEKTLGDKKEKEIIAYLLCFVLEINSICSELSSSKIKSIEEALLRPSKETKVPAEAMKAIKDEIKSMAPQLLEDVQRCAVDNLKANVSKDPVAGCLLSGNVKKYIDKCTKVCWYMSVQDPQVILDGNKSKDGKFDSNKYREYTKHGPYEEFIVWPALYLCQGGQMLSKGIAQGSNEIIIQE